MKTEFKLQPILNINKVSYATFYCELLPILKDLSKAELYLLIIIFFFHKQNEIFTLNNYADNLKIPYNTLKKGYDELIKKEIISVNNGILKYNKTELESKYYEQYKTIRNMFNNTKKGIKLRIEAIHNEMKEIDEKIDVLINNNEFDKLAELHKRRKELTQKLNEEKEKTTPETPEKNESDMGNLNDHTNDDTLPPKEKKITEIEEKEVKSTQHDHKEENKFDTFFNKNKSNIENRLNLNYDQFKNKVINFIKENRHKYNDSIDEKILIQDCYNSLIDEITNNDVKDVIDDIDDTKEVKNNGDNTQHVNKVEKTPKNWVKHYKSKYFDDNDFFKNKIMEIYNNNNISTNIEDFEEKFINHIAKQKNCDPYELTEKMRYYELSAYI